jgi:hypothetical protein
VRRTRQISDGRRRATCPAIVLARADEVIEA